MESPLLNLSTLEQLVQLEAKVPGLLTKHLDRVDHSWERHMQELKDLCRDEDWIKASDIIHKIKGHIGMIGLHKLYEACNSIEINLRAGRPLTAKECDGLARLKQESVAAARLLHINDAIQ